MLNIKNLNLGFHTSKGYSKVLCNVSLSIGKGEFVGIVGESGSGKSVTSLCIMDLLPANAHLESGSIHFSNQSLFKLTQKEKLAIRGKKISMIFQDPMGSLNPCFTIGDQMTEVLVQHFHISKREARDRAIKLFDQVGIPDPQARMSVFPHQLSGGLAQRIMIAMAISCDPELLIADEPTTALDVTIQSQILSLLRRLQKERGMSVILISHDIGLVSQNCSRFYVMYAGEIVEQGPTQELITQPRHPYTQALLSCLPGRNLQSRGKTLPSIPGMVPSTMARPSGCQFHPRCSQVQEVCRTTHPSQMNFTMSNGTLVKSTLTPELTKTCIYF